MHTLKPVRHAIEDEKEITPGDDLLRPVQVHARLVHAAQEKFFDTHFAGDFLKWLFRIADGKRHQNSARPGRNLVDVEPEPVGKKNDLGRNGWHRVVIVLAEETEIDLGECIDFGDAAHLKNSVACALKGRMIGGVSSKLQAEVSLHRGADIRRSGGVDAPSAVFVLMAEDPVGGFLKAFGVAGTEQRMQQDVVGFEGSVSFKLAAPVAFFVLLREKKFTSGLNGRSDAGSKVVDFAEDELRGRRYAGFGGILIHR